MSGARFTLEQAAWAAGAQIAAPGGPFEGAFTDSRKAVPRGLFVALRGDNFDGSDFVAQAVQGGAAGVLVPADALAKARAGAKGVAVLTAPDTGRALGGLAAGWRRRFAAQRQVCERANDAGGQHDPRPSPPFAWCRATPETYLG